MRSFLPGREHRDTYLLPQEIRTGICDLRNNSPFSHLELEDSPNSHGSSDQQPPAPSSNLPKPDQSIITLGTLIMSLPFLPFLSPLSLPFGSRIPRVKELFEYHIPAGDTSSCHSLASVSKLVSVLFVGAFITISCHLERIGLFRKTHKTDASCSQAHTLIFC